MHCSGHCRVECLAFQCKLANRSEYRQAEWKHGNKCMSSANLSALDGLSLGLSTTTRKNKLNKMYFAIALPVVWNLITNLQDFISSLRKQFVRWLAPVWWPLGFRWAISSSSAFTYSVVTTTTAPHCHCSGTSHSRLEKCRHKNRVSSLDGDSRARVSFTRAYSSISLSLLHFHSGFSCSKRARAPSVSLACVH